MNSLAMRPGEKLAHYRIEERIGAGGMGEVYKAHDEKLNRTVALKVLSPESVSDPDRRRRFVQEAQTASALDHPNIVTIHDIGEADGQHFIVMQYVKGPTLRSLVREGLALSTVLDYAVQMADGLAAAHAAGIVHRDFKPENVIVDDRGVPKILDFGLAKLTEPEDVYEAETREQVHLTQEGHIVGTAAYMSPEQAQGKAVDARSDIFSFGSVLYEMVTGRPAFQGDNAASVIAAVLKEVPAPVEPPRLDAVVRRALEKDPALRISSMAELTTELEKLRAAPRAHLALRLPHFLWVGAGVAVLAGIVYVLRAVRDPLPPPRVVPVTSDLGDESTPVLSPDGSRVAFGKNYGPQGHLYVQNVSGGDALRLTEAAGRYSSFAWTPDGQRITFLRESESEQAIYSVPALGGTETKITTAVGTPGHALGMSWSPDGSTLAFVDKNSPDEPTAVFLLDAKTGERTRLTSPPSDLLGDRNPVFSPDGESIAFIRMTTTILLRDVYVRKLSVEREQRLTTESSLVIGVDWTADGRSLIYSSQGSLFRINADGGEPQSIEGVEGRAWWPSVSRQASMLVYERGTEDWNVWRAPGPFGTHDEPQYLFGSTFHEATPEYSPDGSKIAFVSRRSGNREIWTCDNKGEHPVRLTGLGKEVWAPRWSPDGQSLVFSVWVMGSEGHRDIYRIGSAGGIPVRLTSDPANDDLPSWSRDGARIYFASDRSGENQIWKMTVDGNEVNQLSTRGGTNPLESSDGVFVYFVREDRGLWRMPSRGGDEELVLREVFELRWSLNESGVAYINEATQAFDFLDLESGTISSFSAPMSGLFAAGGGVSVSPDGRWFIYPKNDAPGDDIMMLENFR